MTTLVPFTPSLAAPFQFQATLDGNLYTVIISWNLFGQRYYVNIYDSSNVWIVTLPLIGSPSNYPISLTAGYFASKLIFRQATQIFEVHP